MSEKLASNPAELAAEIARKKVFECITGRKNFRFEAGAGAGKTFSLVEVLKFVIAERGDFLRRRNQKVACITYTNVATDEILLRTDRHPAIYASTIHSFCWSLLRSFQPYLREKISDIKGWPERLEEIDDLDERTVEYDLGYPRAKKGEKQVFLGHSDVLKLTVNLLELRKFRDLLTSRFPMIFIDEYQDTNKDLAIAIQKHFIEPNTGPLVGLFGDSWQKIYGEGCGLLDHPRLEYIGKEANFRSVREIVGVLNRMRPELPQAIKDSEASGSVAVFHTNDWKGERRMGGHWADDLPDETAHQYLIGLREQLEEDGWDFSLGRTKILMLTHNVLASEQHYSNLASVFPYNDSFLKKEDPFIAFFADELEPACEAYDSRHYGLMFSLLNRRSPRIQSLSDKNQWSTAMEQLTVLRNSGSVGDVIDFLSSTGRPRLPERALKRLIELAAASPEQIAESTALQILQKFRDVPYEEVRHLVKFINDNTPFSTKHGVKGAEFENVLIVLGRGWNLYNWSQFLEWSKDGIPVAKRDSFERNRNLFYVSCSRPKTRLCLLFTQFLSNSALAQLAEWFGPDCISAFHPTTVT